jgi:hypothetical protein
MSGTRLVSPRRWLTARCKSAEVREAGLTTLDDRFQLKTEL